MARASSAATARERFAAGTRAGRNCPPLRRARREYTGILSGRCPSAQTARPWPRGRPTARCACGMRPLAASAACSAGRPTSSGRCPSAPTARRWPRPAAATAPSTCGKWRRGPNFIASEPSITAASAAWATRRMVNGWCRRAVPSTRRCTCGTPPPASTCASSPATPTTSTARPVAGWAAAGLGRPRRDGVLCGTRPRGRSVSCVKIPSGV